jgi:hypothetical protein
MLMVDYLLVPAAAPVPPTCASPNGAGALPDAVIPRFGGTSAASFATGARSGATGGTSGFDGRL